jgi:[ribosomal protein S5]-alanine N-acetyltransferase
VPDRLPDILLTRRLTLRAPRESDAQAFFASFTQDMEVARYTVWRPHESLNETTAFILDCLQDWASGTAQCYALAFRDDDERPFGLIEARLRAPLVDVGYVLARSHWGQGLMPEAIDALATAALALPSIFRAQATCDVDNRASARALEKSGFVHEGRLERHTNHPNISPEPRPCFLYARCR